MLVTILLCIMIFATGVMFGLTFTNSKADDLPVDISEVPVTDSYQFNLDFEPFSKTGVYVTDRLLDELCEAVNVEFVDLPSFGFIDIRDSTQLKQVYWRAVEVDECCS